MNTQKPMICFDRSNFDGGLLHLGWYETNFPDQNHRHRVIYDVRGRCVDVVGGDGRCRRGHGDGCHRLQNVESGQGQFRGPQFRGRRLRIHVESGLDSD